MAVIILNKPSRNFDVRFHHHPRARLHNLKNISLSIPKNQLVVLTGVSGSGKSTLGFDILFKEGQRQYMEALGLLTWGLAKPPVDSISGLPPTVSLYQQPRQPQPALHRGHAQRGVHPPARAVRPPGRASLPALRRDHPTHLRRPAGRLGG